MIRTSTVCLVVFALVMRLQAEDVGAKRAVTIDGVEYTLEFTADLKGHEDMLPIARRMRDSYFQYYPRVVAWLNLSMKGTPKDMVLTFRDDLKHQACARGNRIEISLPHIRRNPGDTEGLFVHELAHVLQAYQASAPTWFVEGSADYVRFKAFPASVWARENRKRHSVKHDPFGHYWNSAAFLLWMEETQRKSIVREISVHCRNGTYRSELWKELTGKTLESLAKEYSQSVWQPPLK